MISPARTSPCEAAVLLTRAARERVTERDAAAAGQARAS